jgi:L-asparaginase
LKVNLKSGSFHNVSHFVLQHGGAGPQDPRGAKAVSAAQVMSETLFHLAQFSFANEGFPGTAPALPKWFHPLASHQNLNSHHAATVSAVMSVCALENHPLFNAGLGAALQGDGKPRLSAALMESTQELFSGVVNCEGVLNPSLLALWNQSQKFRVLDGNGAALLCRKLGVPWQDPTTLERFDRFVQNRREELNLKSEASLGTGTVGAVTCDSQGRLCALTSTGGVGNETVGRIGDTPTVAGTYCTQSVAVSCTGYGEQILNMAFATRLALRTEACGSLDEAFAQCLKEADAKGYGLAAIALFKNGKKLNWAAGTTEDFFIWGLWNQEPSGPRIHNFSEP